MSVNQLNKETALLLGKITLHLGYMFTCLDGNHLTKAIVEIAMENRELSGVIICYAI